MGVGTHIPLHRHPLPHRELMRRYRHYVGQTKIRRSILVSLGCFLVSILFIQPQAVEFATEHASNSVTDIVLSNIPVYDVGAFFVYGMFFLIGFITLLCFAHPKRIPFTLFALTLFVLVRCIFVSLTHLAPFADVVSDFGPAITRAFFGADLFFSGHTGAPFLMALVFWHDKYLRYTFLAWSVFFAVIVLLGHFHYSIDVVSAYFITYGIFRIAERFFPEERALFLADEASEV